jgi:hypothetical protein
VLKVQGLCVTHEPEPAHLDSAPCGVGQIQLSSKVSSRSFM